jgi:hypothetical protein
MGNMMMTMTHLIYKIFEAVDGYNCAKRCVQVSASLPWYCGSACFMADYLCCAASCMPQLAAALLAVQHWAACS